MERIGWQPLRWVPMEHAGKDSQSTTSLSMRNGYAAVSAGILSAPPRTVLHFYMQENSFKGEVRRGNAS